MNRAEAPWKGLPPSPRTPADASHVPTRDERDRAIRLLLIDDDEDDHLLCADTLERVAWRRYELSWAPDRTAALAELERGDVDAILLDHHLGACTGLELLPELRRVSDAPVVMLTGQGGYEVDRAAVRAGAADYLTKRELTPEVLERSLRHAIERSAAERSLRESEARYRTLIESLREGIVVQARDGRIHTANRSAATLLGLERDAVLGCRLADLPVAWSDENGDPVAPADRPDRVALRSGREQHGAVLRVVRPDRSEVWLEINARPLFGEGETAPHGVLTSLVDVSDRVRSRHELERMAFHDALTGLPNRTLFADRLEQALLRAARSGELVGVGMVDLDRFKAVNDTLGHAAGDELLQEVARRLTGALRESDTVARLGGDEFALLLRGVRDAEGVTCAARRAVEALRRPFTVAGRPVEVTASIGLALAPNDGLEPDAIVEAADRAAYRVKATGRDAFALYSAAASPDERA